MFIFCFLRISFFSKKHYALTIKQALNTSVHHIIQKEAVVLPKGKKKVSKKKDKGGQ